MKAFRALLRGFRDLSDGSGTATLDIPDSHYPENTKQYKQKWGYWIAEEDFKALTETPDGQPNFVMPEVTRQAIKRGMEAMKTGFTIMDDLLSLDAERTDKSAEEGQG